MEQWILDRLKALETRVAELEKKLTAGAVLRSGRMTGDWQPRPETLAFHQEKFPHVDEPKERGKFRDYYQSKGEVRKDWDAAYRNWLRKEDEYSATRAPRSAGRSASRTASINEINRQRVDSFSDQLAAAFRSKARGDGGS